MCASSVPRCKTVLSLENKEISKPRRRSQDALRFAGCAYDSSLLCGLFFALFASLREAYLAWADCEIHLTQRRKERKEELRFTFDNEALYLLQNRRVTSNAARRLDCLFSQCLGPLARRVYTLTSRGRC